MFIQELSALGASHVIQIVLDYKESHVTATVLLTPKDSLKLPENAKAPRSLQFEGPISEVEAAIAEGLQKAVATVGTFTSNMATLQAELDQAAAEARKAGAAKAGAKKPEKVAATPVKEAAKEKPADDGMDLFSTAAARGASEGQPVPAEAAASTI